MRKERIYNSVKEFVTDKINTLMESKAKNPQYKKRVASNLEYLLAIDLSYKFIEYETGETKKELVKKFKVKFGKI
jgi:hypothetical protein